ncbi:MAG TPA: hydroxyethylthiazole kinase [Pseudorhodoplanes sp.]|nr:hydroxyethylthiazole kinase [Pseudorhodoplanes sp.]
MHGSPHALAGDFPAVAADVIARLRERPARVHCITNAVAQAFTANILLAVGAIPSMTIAPQEIADFSARADALLVNLGTLDNERRAAIEIALAQAAERMRPWVLDPVLIDVSAPRAAYARALAERKPAVIRLNAAEFAALADAPASAETLARIAEKTNGVIGLTGATDIVSDGKRRVTIANGHALMQAVTAMGCAASALVSACLCVEKDAFIATSCALLAFGVAGEIAAQSAKGPGSFAVAFIDALHALDRTALIERARVS